MAVLEVRAAPDPQWVEVTLYVHGEPVAGTYVAPEDRLVNHRVAKRFRGFR